MTIPDPRSKLGDDEMDVDESEQKSTQGSPQEPSHDAHNNEDPPCDAPDLPSSNHDEQQYHDALSYQPAYVGNELGPTAYVQRAVAQRQRQQVSYQIPTDHNHQAQRQRQQVSYQIPTDHNHHGPLTKNAGVARYPVSCPVDPRQLYILLSKVAAAQAAGSCVGERGARPQDGPSPFVSSPPSNTESTSVETSSPESEASSLNPTEPDSSHSQAVVHQQHESTTATEQDTMDLVSPSPEEEETSGAHTSETQAQTATACASTASPNSTDQQVRGDVDPLHEPKER